MGFSLLAGTVRVSVCGKRAESRRIAAGPRRRGQALRWWSVRRRHRCVAHFDEISVLGRVGSQRS